VFDLTVLQGSSLRPKGSVVVAVTGFFSVMKCMGVGETIVRSKLQARPKTVCLPRTGRWINQEEQMHDSTTDA
jgi:hypothetical protein